MTMTIDRLTEIKKKNEELVMVRRLVAHGPQAGSIQG